MLTDVDCLLLHNLLLAAMLSSVGSVLAILRIGCVSTLLIEWLIDASGSVFLLNDEIGRSLKILTIWAFLTHGELLLFTKKLVGILTNVVK